MSRDQLWHIRPWVVGHRGAPRHHSENTVASFEAAIASGADAIEFDVRCSADGVLLVHHNAMVRLPSARRPAWIRKLSYADICAILARTPQESRRGRLVGGGSPPRVEDVVEQFGHRIRLDIEIKEAGHEAELLHILARHMAADRYVITSFRDEVITACTTIAPEVHAGLLLDWHGAGSRVGLFPFRRASRCGAQFIVPHKALVDTSLLDRARHHAIPVMVFTVNHQRRLEAMLHDPRIAGVITDVPDVAVRIRDSV